MDVLIYVLIGISIVLSLLAIILSIKAIWKGRK
uniref:Cytochrome oxidase maturation protein cbb3-type n=1 Tax=Myoviridae sp. ctr0w28 TaxID=2826703 RepID=A0A8S5NRT7_9CAUD|nr:MAG TPA: Cytochrome oxidase maturation protein cbb3-type [Myoviridae sp. ctr0w28]